MAERKVTLNDVSAKEAKAKDAALQNAVGGIRKEFGEGASGGAGVEAARGRLRTAREAPGGPSGGTDLPPDDPLPF